MDHLDLERRLDALASLAGPVRLALYRCVADREHGMGRDEAAAAAGVSRALAAYHLDKLADAGLLDVRFERRSGRSGPGAGRTAKLYRRSPRPLEVALPARNYRLIAELLAEAVRADPSGAASAALERAARAVGAENAVHADEDHSRPRDAAGVHAVLARHGYEPYDDEGVTRLRNCPFERLAQTHRELVCRANLAFVEGLIQGRRARGLRAVLDPRPGRCCVALSSTA
jgi:predicted ArsR family transcriptional regulator